MKKQLIAAAVLSTFAGVAAAQSSVTLYGVADIGISNHKPAKGQSSVTALAAGNQSGNRWGLRGTEDLGNGLKANFVLESGFNLDTGASAQGGRLFGRQAFVGLGGGFGEVRFGRQTLQSSVVLGGIDAFGQGFGMASLAGSVLAATTMRADNTIGYFSPTIGGFSVGLQYSLENVSGSANSSENESENATANNEHLSLAARYATGPFVAALTYDSINNKIAGTSNQTMWTLGGSYDFGVARVFATFTDENDVFATSGNNTSTAASYVGPSAALTPGVSTAARDSRSYSLGVTVPMDALMLHAQYQRRNDKTTANEDFSVWAIGATYSLSKRTNLYTTFADRSASGAPALAGSTREQREFLAGIRHTF